MATIVKGTYVQTAKKAAEFAADTTTIWSKNQLLIEEDTLKMKVGDGINVFSQLKYATVSPTEVQKLIADSSHSHINKAVLDQINQDMVERMQQEAVTPIANVKSTDDGAEITITDYKGTTKAEIKNGKEINTYYNEEDETIYIGGDGGFSDLTQTQIEQIEKNKTNISSIKSNLIVYQNDTPSDDTTKVWLDSSNEDQDNITVPDMNDFNELSEKVDSIMNNGGSGNGISNIAKNLLISILQNAVYTTNQKSNIEALTNALSSSSSTDESVTIIYNLTNVTSTNNAYTASKGSSYTTSLSAGEGYKINAVSVIMADQDVTTAVYSKDTITISNVTGNIIITAIAIKDSSLSSKLPIDGLLANFDFRNKEMAEYKLTNWGTVYKCDDETDNYLAFGATAITAGENGLENYSIREIRSKNNEGTAMDLGNEFTAAVYTSGSPSILESTVIDNIGSIKVRFQPIYVNSSNSETKTTVETPTKTSRETFMSLIITVSSNILKIYLDGELQKTYDGSEISDFAKWKSSPVNSATVYNNGILKSTVLYNKALSDSEIVDLHAYFKSLEG